MIQVSELHYSTDDGIKVLEDVHLHVDRGESIVLLGPPSSGKSLLLGLLAAVIPPQRGQILVHGRNVARLSRLKILELQRRIGFYRRGLLRWRVRSSTTCCSSCASSGTSATGPRRRRTSRLRRSA